MDQEPLLHMRRADTSYELTRWQHFSVQNDLIAYLLEEHPAKFYPDPI